jgi:hypothetical protein
MYMAVDTDGADDSMLRPRVALWQYVRCTKMAGHHADDVMHMCAVHHAQSACAVSQLAAVG